ncbi:hypothetical protein AA13595_0210 [Gluconacetobacter johannae DSM 13595]|uniref:Uncharacterized protein n=1 Tax=Gluconacetobacter johannae TaxID=112140 RepID=A0A7W4J7Z4_9PROT|nr:hypothetical protein [Gluconacetobacter johannae]MBB2176102.1 hypothetical protein [Gluconacetobacter johannae]GBQ80061.1 hypothetical protein AA13595_0210 [Gluconacetobacter johannae DSM 13595]
METHSAGARDTPSPEMTMQEVLGRVASLLELACGDLLDAQRAVDECLQTHALGDKGARDLQKLDLATQTVDAVATVLRNLMSCSEVATPVQGIGLYDGVKLDEVVRVLRGDNALGTTQRSGEVDLF